MSLVKWVTYGVMVSVPSLLSAQHVHLSPQSGHSGSVPVILDLGFCSQRFIWDHLLSAMHATNSQTFLATSYLRNMYYIKTNTFNVFTSQLCWCSQYLRAIPQPKETVMVLVVALS